MKISKVAARAGQLVVLFIVCYYLGYRNLVLNWGELKTAQWSFSFLPFTGSLLGIALIFVANSQIWRMMIYTLGRQRVNSVGAAYIWFISNLGRYLPGRVWQIAGMAMLSRAEGVSAVNATAGAVIGQGVHLLAGAVVGLALLPAEQASRFAPLVRWSWIGLVPLLICLYPPFLRRLLGLAARWRGKEPLEITVSGRDILFWFTLNVLVWLAYGVCFYYFVRAVSPSGGMSLTTAIGVYAVGYIVGFLALFSPGGLGVREVIIAGLLTSTLGEVGATAVALVSRIWLTLAELVPVVILLVLRGMPSTAKRAAPEV